MEDADRCTQSKGCLHKAPRGTIRMFEQSCLLQRSQRCSITTRTVHQLTFSVLYTKHSTTQARDNSLSSLHNPQHFSEACSCAFDVHYISCILGFGALLRSTDQARAALWQGADTGSLIAFLLTAMLCCKQNNTSASHCPHQECRPIACVSATVKCTCPGCQMRLCRVAHAGVQGRASELWQLQQSQLPLPGASELQRD